MRKTLSFVVSVLATVFVISCEKDNNGPDNGGTTGNSEGYLFTLDESTPSTLEFDWRSDTVIVKYSVTNPTATGMVNPTADVDWLTFNTQISFGDIYVYAAENLDFEDRSAQVTFSYEDTEYTLDVIQISREWDQEVICPYIQGYYYGDQLTPNTGIHSAQFYISDTGWGDTGYDQDPDGHYFQINLYFPEQPEGTSFCPEGTYTLSDQYGEYTMFSTGSSYFPGTQVLTARQLFSSGTCTIAKDGDNYVVDLDVVTVDDQLSRHARYTGPVELSIL